MHSKASHTRHCSAHNSVRSSRYRRTSSQFCSTFNVSRVIDQRPCNTTSPNLSLSVSRVSRAPPATAAALPRCAFYAIRIPFRFAEKGAPRIELSRLLRAASPERRYSSSKGHGRAASPLMRSPGTALLVAALAIACLAQTIVEPSQLDPGARCEPFLASNANCQGLVPVGTLIYLNSSTTQASADAFATTQAGAQLSAIPAC